MIFVYEKKCGKDDSEVHIVPMDPAEFDPRVRLHGVSTYKSFIYTADGGRVTRLVGFISAKLGSFSICRKTL